MNPVDLTDCENEPLRFPGTVMPHGALLVLQPGPAALVEAASQSCGPLLGLTSQEMLGSSLGDLLGAEAAAALTAARSDDQRPVLRLSLKGREFLARTSVNEAAQTLVDIEPALPESSSVYAILRQCRRELDGLRRLTGFLAVPQAVTDSLRAITGFDRVMIYRFDEAWNGEVIAEARRDDIEPNLGLHYPAGDIPRPAHDHFQACKLRLIPDVDHVPSALIAADDARSVDLGRSALRVSPLHIEYLKTMGVRASLVGDLVVEGRLWGLLACHHVSGPKYFGPDVLEVLEWLCGDVAALIEVTLIRQRQERIQSHLRALLESIPDLVWLKDLEGRYVICNPAFQQFLGADGADILGRTDYDFVARDLADFFRQKDAEALAAGKSLVNEERIASNGHPVLLETIKTPVRDAEGKDIAVLGIARDITGRKTMEVELRRSNAELEQFISLAAHDLREPLRMVSSYLSLIERRLGAQIEGELKTYFGFAVGGAKRMNRMISNLLKYSLLGGAGDFGSVQLAEVIGEACLAHQQAIHQNNVVVSLGPDMPAVAGVKSDLRQLFEELIGNAIKCRSPDRQLVIEIAWREQADNVVVWVQDNGVGVAAEQCERAFQIFQKLGPDDTLDGSGIGLAVCKKIVERHGGRIWIDSEVGTGCTIFLTFPVHSG